jgi:hypothetical protein
MPRRTPTQDDTAAVSGPICGKVEARDDDRSYVCIRNPGHLGACNPVPADREAVKRLAKRAQPTPEGGFFDAPESPTDVLAMQTPASPEPEPAEHWTCAAESFEAGGERYVCDRHDKHDPDVQVGGHYWRLAGERIPTDDSTLVTGNPSVLPAASPPDGGQAADPTPPVVPSAGASLEPSGTADHLPAGSGGGGSGRSQTAGQSVDRPPTPTRPERSTGMEVEAAAGRPSTGRSIGRVIANTAIDAALGVPVDVQDERAHGREATEILVEAAADHWRHNRHMPAGRLLDLQAVVDHMVTARGLR